MKTAPSVEADEQGVVMTQSVPVWFSTPDPVHAGNPMLSAARIPRIKSLRHRQNSKVASRLATIHTHVDGGVSSIVAAIERLTKSIPS